MKPLSLTSILLPMTAMLFFFVCVRSATDTAKGAQPAQRAPLAHDADGPEPFTSGRIKRWADASTQFVGINIDYHARMNNGDYTRIKNVAQRVQRPGGRYGRSIHFSNTEPEKTTEEQGAFKIVDIRPFPKLRLTSLVKGASNNNPVQVPSKLIKVMPNIMASAPATPFISLLPATTGLGNLLTMTQKVFYDINNNFALATRLKDEYLIQTLKDLSASGSIDTNKVLASQRLIVVNETGITCSQLCDTTETEGIGYGTIGICTPNFCRCDFSSRQSIRSECPGKEVFDPMLKACNDPRAVVLCNDEAANPVGLGRSERRPTTGATQ